MAEDIAMFLFVCIAVYLVLLKSHPNKDFKLEMMVKLCLKILRKSQKQRDHFASCVTERWM